MFRFGISFTDALGQVGLSGAGIPEPGTLGFWLLKQELFIIWEEGEENILEERERESRKAREGRK